MNMFDRWLHSMDVKEDFTKLRELVLLEEFKECVPSEVKTYLSDRGVVKLESAARMADDYVLSHKEVFEKKGPKFAKWNSRGNKNFHPSQSHKTSEVSNKNDNSKPGNADIPGSQADKNARKGNRPVCSFCHKVGHTYENCFKRKNQEGKSVALINQNKVSCATENPVTEFNSDQGQLQMNESLVAKRPEGYDGFISYGSVGRSEACELRQVCILRDTGANQSLIVADALPPLSSDTTDHVLIKGVGGHYQSVPLCPIFLKSELKTGLVSVGVVPSLPVEGVTFLLGNDLAGSRVRVSSPNLVMTSSPTSNEDTEQLSKLYPGIFPACVTTRSMARASTKITEDIPRPKSTSVEDEVDCKNNLQNNTIVSTGLDDESEVVLADTFFHNLEETPSSHVKMFNIDNAFNIFSREQLIKEQDNDPEIVKIKNQVVSEEESTKDPVCYYKTKSGVVMRKWRSPSVPADDVWESIHQIVVPKVYHAEILKIAHEQPMSGHLGVRKTVDRIMRHFFWPGLHSDVSKFCKSCETCQLVGKPNQGVPKAPLIPIPACGVPFDRVIIDCVGPLPKTRSGNMYLFTIMDVATRYPEAIPLRKITSKAVAEALVKFFTKVGLPKQVQHDQGSNFTSGLFKQVLQSLGVEQIVSTAYHPQTQGALERYHQTLKSMLRKFRHDFQDDWDKGVDLLLFATRETPNESTGFSPFELIYGHEVRGPLKLLKEKWLCEPEAQTNVLDFVSTFQERLFNARQIALDNLGKSQTSMKVWYDKKAQDRTFKKGDKVLLLLPTHGDPLRAKFCGPYLVQEKRGKVNYVISTPDRRKKKRLCHINMLKEFYDRTSTVNVAVAVSEEELDKEEDINEDHVPGQSTYVPPPSGIMYDNTETLQNLNEKLKHLDEAQRQEIVQIIGRYPRVFRSTPGRTTLVEHDVDVKDSPPIKQQPYRMNPMKQEIVKKEIQYMLENNLISPSNSPWSSPVLLVPKEDGTQRLCIDYRKVNSVTVTDSFPIPRLDDCIDRIGHATYVSKFDLLKGYWQVPLTERARKISAFATNEGLYECNVMSFGMKNAPATFTRLMSIVTRDLVDCETYIDDVIIYSDTWEAHVERMEAFFARLDDADLTINLKKSEIGQAHVTYLGHIVGQGKVSPKLAKVEAILNFPVPTDKRGIQRFLGMVGFFRKFCPNFSEIAAALTALLEKNTKFVWSPACQTAFDKLKSILVNHPVLRAADYTKPFKIATDASDVGVGAVLLQADENNVAHPVAYFSKKLNKHQRKYSTIEKEALSLILAITHFEVYVTGPFPVTIYTDHHPLKYINKFKNNSRKLMRWSLYLQQFNLEYVHLPGKLNVVADSLSRFIKG
ncbi:hypothetical protein HOLleu_43415 [Holothuria leucospilota]|uniref:Reverse transcriptase n=1 Tax=Holothuria leucospilota TaxID=206669 RepID=A0A9Q0YBW8_HOLLE|nr:hypothetical protein HOLleu_43415 [Holothuria leucospilota]